MPLIEQQIAIALERAEFVPFFQPLVELRTGRIEGFEVLARWHNPARGMVLPDNFIPAMQEQRGLINALTVCLLRKTFAAALAVPERIGFSINVSPSQFHDPSLPSLLACMAKEAQFDLRRLTVELTESALLGDLKLAGEVAAGLKALGIKLALDDFGTGYSSLLHLQALPFDELKVDISFVRTMVQSRQSRKITSAVVSLGQSLGLRTIAEGVESASQAELLLWQGCNLAQGWLYERPVAAEQLAEVLAKQLPVTDPSAAASPEVLEAANTIDTLPRDRVSQLRAIYDGAPVGLIFLDRDLRYVSLNQRLAELNGISIKAHLGRKVADVAPAIFKQTEPYLRRALKGEAITNVEISTPAKATGKVAGTLLASYQPARDEAGEVIGVSIAISDISKIKQNEQALRTSETQARQTLEKLRDSEAQLRTILQSVPVGIVLADAPTGIVVSVNPRAAAIFGSGLRPGVLWADIVRQGVDETGAALDPDNMPMLRAIRHGEITEGLQVSFRRPKTRRLWLSVSGSPIYSDEGEVLGGVIAVQVLERPKRKRLKIFRDARDLSVSYANVSAESAQIQAKESSPELEASSPRFGPVSERLNSVMRRLKAV